MLVSAYYQYVQLFILISLLSRVGGNSSVKSGYSSSEEDLAEILQNGSRTDSALPESEPPYSRGNRFDPTNKLTDKLAEELKILQNRRIRTRNRKLSLEGSHRYLITLRQLIASYNYSPLIMSRVLQLKIPSESNIYSQKTATTATREVVILP